MTAASAILRAGGRYPAGLYRTPVVAIAAQVPGEVSIEVGRTMSGLPVTITTDSAEWLDYLESAIQVARAQLIIRATLRHPVMPS